MNAAATVPFQVSDMLARFLLLSARRLRGRKIWRRSMLLHGFKKLSALVALFLTTIAFAGSPHYSDLKLSDSDDGDATTSFTPDTPKIFLNAALKDVPSGSKLSSVWVAEDTGGVAPANYKIDSVSMDSGSLMNVATFSLSKPTAGWPVGKYRVDLFIDGNAAGSVRFKIAPEN
jgi:hypothetical protein